MKSYVYVLRCFDNTYYVGRTTQLVTRFEKHRTGQGAKWTKTHGTDSIVDLREDGPFVELSTTLEYIQKYGLDKVRGGPWCQESLSSLDKRLIENILDSEGFARTESSSPEIPMTSADPNNLLQEASTTAPTRAGKKWTVEEDQSLRSEIQMHGTSITSLAASHGRSAGAIGSRVATYVREQMKQDNCNAQIAMDSLHVSTAIRAEVACRLVDE